MAGTSVNPLLLSERRKATFKTEDLTYVLDFGKERTERRRYVEKLAIDDPQLAGPDMAYLDRDAQYTEATRKAVHMVKRLKELGFTNEPDRYFYRRMVAPHENMPIDLHRGMFMPTLESQTNEEQYNKWVPRAKNLEIIGTYAQTEMGHGTFIRGLETTATYDPKTEEFVMHSPTLTSLKWWPGNLGKSVNHAVVMAKLYSQGQYHGIYPFFVQLRSMEDHSTMPGIILGDIGPKFGYNTNDNGYLGFKHVRIPRTNMLMKNAQVLKDGTFVKTKSDRLTYGVMTLVRANIVGGSASNLAQACTIAIRYSTIRQQSEIRPGVEPQVLDYQTQQYKLFPLLATSYALWFAGRNMILMYFSINAEISAGNLELLPELHALSAGLKAFASDTASQGIEVCRMSCGGHGYSHASGIPKIYVDATPACTYEGENTVMFLQTARYLIKSYNQAKQGQKLRDSVAYLSEKNFERCLLANDANVEALIAAYKHRAARHVKHCGEKLAQQAARGLNEQEAWNSCSVELTKAAVAHCHFNVVKIFVEMINMASTTDEVKTVLDQLLQLYALHGIVENSGDFMQDGYMSQQQLDMANQHMLDLLAAIRPNAVALVDAFDFPDRLLGSVLGRYDGQVYPNLMKFAQESPLNKTDVHPAYQKYLRPMIKGEKSKL